MIEKLKKLLTRDRSVELKLIELVNRQQDFIDKNIHERVIYADPQTGYTNDHKYEKEEQDDDEVFEVPEDMTPEQLAEYMEGNQEEGNKK